MLKVKGLIFCAALAAGIGCGSVQAESRSMADADTPTAEGMVFDLVIGRPIGFVATVAGSALFVALLPFTIFTADVPKKTFKALVAEPFTFTFVRPLGE